MNKIQAADTLLDSCKGKALDVLIVILNKHEIKIKSTMEPEQNAFVLDTLFDSMFEPEEELDS